MSITPPYATSAHEGGFLIRRKTSPIAIGGAIAVHVGVVAVVLLMPGTQFSKDIYDTIKTYAVPADPPPPDRTPPPPSNHHEITQKSVIDAPRQEVILPDHTEVTSSGSDTITILPPHDPPPIHIDTPPVPKLVFVDSRLDPRYARNLQPDYPPARLREDEEGKVTVRVHIGADGRVLSVEEVSASHPDFWRATQAQALKAWRFVPATRDGVAVESVREMTVYFRMNS